MMIVETKKVEFKDLLNYVPNENKDRFIHDLIIYVPHLKEEADKFSNEIHNVAIGLNMRNYINHVKELAMKVYDAAGDSSRMRANIQYRQLVYWVMYKTLPVTYQGIADEFEKKHATIIHGVKRFEETMEISWKERMLVQYFVEKMQDLGYAHPAKAYNDLIHRLKIK